MNMLTKLAFIGAGSMTEAMISGIVNKGFLKKDNIIVTNRRNQERLNFLQEKYQIHCVRDSKKAVKDAEIIILSMQPFDVKEAVQSLERSVTSDQLIISVAAGISTEFISSLFHEHVPIIRAIPNMPASIGLAATAIAKGESASEEHVRVARALFNTIGTTAVIEEEDMHIVTGLSGSGPAFVYYLAEAMEKAAVELGLEIGAAKTLISQTFLGAGKMLLQTNNSATELRKQVMSPAGTTEAGINTLVNYEFERIIFECIKSARDRSIELGR